MPASSALRANLTQPSMSGRAAGELLLVVATRDVSWTVFMLTSPPFGNIQWNLRLMVSQALISGSCPQEGAGTEIRPYILYMAGARALGLPDQRQDLAAETAYLVYFRATRDD